jgi:hypothetical protein
VTTFLQLCKDVARECDVSNGEAAVASVAAQVGQVQRIVAAVRDEWILIQNRHQDWRWMRSEFTFTTVVGDDSYAYTDATDVLTAATISRFAKWVANDDADPIKCYLTTVSNERWLQWLPWESFKSIYKIGTQNNGVPTHVSVDPQNNLRFGPKPNDTYTITGPYQRGAQVLSAGTDEPDLPSRYHQLLMFSAMRRYGYGDAATETITYAEKQIRTMLRQLEADQLPSVRIGSPMA